MRVGIIGGGRMGRWLRSEISRVHEAAVFDVDPSRSEASSLGELVGRSDVLIVAVGFRDAGRVLEDLAKYDLCGKLVMDIATFKKYVIGSYRALPDCALAASVHPMFGPGARSIKGRRVVVMEVPGRRGFREAAEFFKGLGAEVVEGSVEEHDEYVKYTIALSYAVGLALARVYSKRGWDKLAKYGGTSFRYLSVFAASLLGDPSAPAYAEEAGEAVKELIDGLKESGAPAPPPGLENAYELFYAALEALGY
ncbi:MAG: NAD(P)-binding domain-containing protein [Thermoproteus sp. AZ2]|jgi:prephenate dehydrogenase|uniref:NAD(P)-binding domain-containing protein n=1 Tax=Thermoproteus sp. AZ2 TaxID=1609232 RepID=A0ACC6V1D8_9CREN|nr:MAG: chorismate mutase [Thermoproteus sp. AZ2]